MNERIPTTTQLEAAISALQRFLLSDSVQVNAGPHAGAVVGALNEQGQPRYVYGEITGYYLHWLASLGQPTLAMRARAAHSWIRQQLQAPGWPATRVYLNAPEADWRNQAAFVFDYAMIAGGLARAADRQLIELDPATSAALIARLQDFVDDGQLRACRALQAAAVLPKRWSTQGGAFSAKTASRILLLSAVIELPTALVNIARETLRAIASAAEQNGLDMLHPTLYAIEGCLLEQAADVRRLRVWLDQILALQAGDGSLPESLTSATVRRSDIIAQALRVAMFLQERGQGDPDMQRKAAALANALIARQLPEGAMPFEPTQQNVANIWCSMFAEQALRLYAATGASSALPFPAEDLV